jgi:hypothetical protein
MPTTTDTDTLELEFERVRDTKNTVVFAEVVEEDEAAAVGSLYVQKHALPALGKPTRITVTIGNDD